MCNATFESLIRFKVLPRRVKLQRTQAKHQKQNPDVTTGCVVRHFSILIFNFLCETRAARGTRGLHRPASPVRGLRRGAPPAAPCGCACGCVSRRPRKYSLGSRAVATALLGAVHVGRPSFKLATTVEPRETTVHPPCARARSKAVGRLAVDPAPGSWVRTKAPVRSAEPDTLPRRGMLLR